MCKVYADWGLLYLLYRMHVSRQIRKVTNIFTKTNIRIAYKCYNTIANLIQPPRDHHNPPHNKWGIYRLTCNTCNLLYVGQTTCSLNIRFQEHIRYIRYSNPQSAYALHILQNQHEYCQMNSTMTLLKPLKTQAYSCLTNNTISNTLRIHRIHSVNIIKKHTTH